MKDQPFTFALGQLYGGTTNPLRLAWRKRAQAECLASTHQDQRGPTWWGSVALLGAMAGAAVLSMAAVDAALASDAAAAAPTAVAEDPPHPLGQHPAIIVQRLQASAGYDYGSKFYPHPAWLYLSATPPAISAPASEAVAATRSADRSVSR